ncbi:uncharacterized protein PHACADRAFT_255851 [Phanerochaete carnosa HHB-10118-sp]|uniref:Mitochondrial import inner membrane translocase subunit TIM54 n=1 Tax=Phanerochaete carnosa (strain HHB-10118-sp) TaxID=650164 RepID=K5VUZ1_PHACS|nr:uncharacterized protein PHACADRAFT_255851 [Phanerochaete carnosa HHB-10118-sp]EKM55318.1 hypothetical protein PHACADRAFT_255851 [Phanerochaete carnosa HHB-10118-sp]
MINGRRHGELAERIANDIKKRRRLDAGIDQLPFNPMNLPGNNPEVKQARELEGGIVIIGRPTFKEFMAGLKRGWLESLEIVDKEERLSRELENDGRFDEPELEPSTSFNAGEDEPIPTPSKLKPSFVPPHLKSGARPPSSQNDHQPIPSALNIPPASIPPQPPLLLVPFLNYIGLTQIPHMIWEFFNERHKVRSGAEAAYRIIVGETRPVTAPSNFEDADPTPAEPFQAEPLSEPLDINFNKDFEAYYKASFVKDFTSEIQKAREGYYQELSKKLETARALARGSREPTKDEVNYPPPTEVELRAERMKKELRWRSDEAGWDIVKPSSSVAWDERFRSTLRVFVEPSSEREAEFRRQAEEIMSSVARKEEEQQ